MTKKVFSIDEPDPDRERGHGLFHRRHHDDEPEAESEAALAEEPEPAAADPLPELGVLLTRAGTAQEAFVIAALLKAYGIESNVADRANYTYVWARGEGTAIYVHEDDLE